MNKRQLCWAFFCVVLLMMNTAYGEGLYRSSVVGTDFDYITDDDPSNFLCLEYEGLSSFEMPDKRHRGNLHQTAYVFAAHFTDGTQVLIAMDEDFEDRAAAEQNALRYTARLGKLPTLYREKIRHIVVHKGGVDTTAFAEDLGHFFVIYSDNAAKRITTNDLEETFFHEGSHASIQSEYLDTAAWKNAKAADGAFVTDYAKTNAKEDFAESALFAYTIIHFPERIPAAERAKIESVIPNRIDFFRTVYTEPLTYSVGKKHTCSARAAYPKDAPSEKDIVIPTTDTAPASGALLRSNGRTALKRPISDILFDALVLGLDQEEESVADFALEKWSDDREYTDEAIIRAASDRFGFPEAELKAEIEKWRYFDDSVDDAQAIKKIGATASPGVEKGTRASPGEVVSRARMERDTADVAGGASPAHDSNVLGYTITALLGLILGVLLSILITLLLRSRG